MNRTEILDLQPFNAGDYLDSDEAVEVFFNDAWASESRLEIADALALIAKAKGAQAAIEAVGLSPAFHEQPVEWDNPPSWDILLRAITALGLKLKAVTEKPAA